VYFMGIVKESYKYNKRRGFGFMGKITQRYLNLGVCIVFSLLLLGVSANAINGARNSSPAPLTDVFARSGFLMNPETNQPIEINGKPLPANAANLPTQSRGLIGKGQCALYVKNDIMRFNGALKGNGLNNETLTQVHLKLGSSIYPPELREDDDWAKTGSIAVAECRKVALNVTRVLRDYLKNGERPEESGAKEQEEINEEKEVEAEHFSELQRIKSAICRVFNPTIRTSKTTPAEEAEEEEESKEAAPPSRVSLRQQAPLLNRSSPKASMPTAPAVGSASPRSRVAPVSRRNFVVPKTPTIMPEELSLRSRSNSLAKPGAVTQQKQPASDISGREEEDEE